MGGGLSAPGRRRFNFGGKHVFLTGGANGIGFCALKLLLHRGASVTFTDIADATAALAELDAVISDNKLPGKAAFIKADVSNYDQMLAAVAKAEHQQGPIDCLIPNAGIASGGLFLDEGIESLERVNRINYMGVVYTLKAGLPGMVQRKSGCILMMASLMAMYAGFCSSAYVAPKAAILSLANALRLELLGTGVDITIALPAFTDTAMRNVGLDNPNSPELAKQLTREMKIYSPNEVAELALQGVEKGYFFSKSPDLNSNLAIASMAGLAPRVFNEFLEFLLLPLYFLTHILVRRRLETRILNWRSQEARKSEATKIRTSGNKELANAAIEVTEAGIKSKTK